ncbi:MAG: Maf family protein [Parvibaculales bacterium]
MTSPKDGSPIVTNDPLWLASASPRRQALLKQIGLTPDKVMPADIDETPAPRELPQAYAKRMAIEKGKRIDLQGGDGAPPYVLSADTVVAVGRRILPKTTTEEQVRTCLHLLSGRAHRVYTGISLMHADTHLVKIVQSRVHFKRLNEDEIAWYIDTGDWEGKAGGYAIQGQAAVFVKSLQGSFSNVVGLPLFETAGLLKGCGYRF